MGESEDGFEWVTRNVFGRYIKYSVLFNVEVVVNVYVLIDFVKFIDIIKKLQLRSQISRRYRKNCLRTYKKHLTSGVKLDNR